MSTFKRIFDHAFPLTLDPLSETVSALAPPWTCSANTKSGFVTDGAFEPGGDPRHGAVGIVMDLDSGRAVTLVNMISDVQCRSGGLSVHLYDGAKVTPLYSGKLTFEGGCPRFVDVSELRPHPDPEIVAAATKARIVMSGEFIECE